MRVCWESNSDPLPSYTFIFKSIYSLSLFNYNSEQKPYNLNPIALIIFIEHTHCNILIKVGNQENLLVFQLLIVNFFLFQVFNTRIFKIKERHLFLVYLGKAQYDPTKPNYVSLDKVVSFPDEVFCKEIAKTSVNDFEKFLKTL